MRRPGGAGERLLGKFGPGGRRGAEATWTLLGSFVAGVVSFLLATVLATGFGLLVFHPLGDAGVAVGVQMAVLGVNILANGSLALLAKLPCAVATCDNGVVAPVVAATVLKLAFVLGDDKDGLMATAVACVSLASAIFGAMQLVLAQLGVARFVQYLPYSIPMGFLSGVGLELCWAISLAGSYGSRGVAAAFAICLALGSWWRGWSLAVLFPALLFISVSGFWLLSGDEEWLMRLQLPAGGPDALLTGLWAPGTPSAVRWGILLEHAPVGLGVLCLLGSFQNCLFAPLYARAPSIPEALHPDDILREFSLSFALGGLCGVAGGFHNMACFSLSRELKSHPRAPNAIIALLSLALVTTTGLWPVLLLPRFVFAGMLLWVGMKFLRVYFLQPARMLPHTETAIIAVVAGTMKAFGFATGVLLGLALAMVSVVRELATLGSIQHQSTGRAARSNALRSAKAEKLLLQHGHTLVVRLAPGFVFFATSGELLFAVQDWLSRDTRGQRIRTPVFEGHDSVRCLPASQSSRSLCTDTEDSEVEQGSNYSKPFSDVVIDFCLCRGFDGSLVGVLAQLADLGARRGFNLRLAGLPPAQHDWLKDYVAHAGICSFFPDLDRALESVENDLLSVYGHTESIERRLTDALMTPQPRKARRSSLQAADLWQDFVRLVAIPGLKVPLGGLAARLNEPWMVRAGDALYSKGQPHDSVYFVVEGLLSLWNEGESRTKGTPLWTSRGLRYGDTGEEQDIHRQSHDMLQQGTSRLLRIGPGWALGELPAPGGGLGITLFTCLAETDAVVLELPVACIPDLDPEQELALRQLLGRSSRLMLQHATRQLSEWHSVAYGAPAQPHKPRP